MNFMEIRSFYGELAKEKAIGESLAKRIRGISSEAELQKLIQDEILPLAKMMGYDFSEKDLLEYEKMVAQKLSPEDLLNVSGGVSLKSALLSGGIFSLAMLGFGSIAPMQADAMVPKAVVESVTGGVVVSSVADQVQTAIKPELKGKVSLQEVIQPLMRIIAVQNTTSEQKESAVKLLLNLVSEDKKEDLRASIENIKSTLPADINLTEDVKEILSKTNEMLENIAQVPQYAGLAADKELVIPDTEMLVEEAKDGQEVELSQTDYGYILDAWNGAEALVYKLTGLTENFRFLNPANRPTLEKKDGEKYFRWKYNEDSGDGFGELMRILFPCSDGQRIVTGGGAPNVPAFYKDCEPTVKLMAQIAAMLYKYRTATPEEKAQLNKEISAVLAKLDMISDRLHHEKDQKELNKTFKDATSAQAKQNEEVIQKYETLMKEYDDLFAQVRTLFDQHQNIKKYNESPSEDNKFNAMLAVNKIPSVKSGVPNEIEKNELLGKLHDWFKGITTFGKEHGVSALNNHKNFTTLQAEMKKLKENKELSSLLQSIATDSKKVLNDDTLFASGSFCDNVIHANTIDLLRNYIK